MCFSAAGSFVASGVLTAAGIASKKQAGNKKKWRLLAIVPFIFAFQQLLEGLQWLTVKPSFSSLLLGYGFLFFAFLFWPVYVPAVALKIEKSKRNRKILLWLQRMGILISLFLFYVLLTESLTVGVINHSIDYQIHIPLAFSGAVLYVLVVVGSMLVSSDVHVRWFGWLTLLSAIVAWVFFAATFTSVWCFFAAVVSGLIYIFIKKHA